MLLNKINKTYLKKIKHKVENEYNILTIGSSKPQDSIFIKFKFFHDIQLKRKPVWKFLITFLMWSLFFIIW